MKLILKVILSTFFLLLGYAVLIKYYKPNAQIAQHQWQDNFIKAQNYLYNKNCQTENIIVGSSMSSRISTKNLIATYNLSFSGQDIFDGLELIKKSSVLPGTIFVETNVLFKKHNEDFLTSLCNPVLFEIRKNIPVMRDGKQPIALAGVPLLTIIISGIKKKTLEKNTVAIVSDGVNKITYAQFLSLHKSEYNIEPSKETIDDAILKLKAYVQYFEERNVEVIFFEMPIDPTLCMLKHPVSIRASVLRSFPKNKFIRQPDCSLYSTSDGIHLSDAGEVTYGKFIRSYMDSINRFKPY